MRRNSVAFQIRQISVNLAVVLAIFAGAPHRCAAQSLQSFVSHLMSAKAGAVIVSDPRTGRILALVNQQGAFEQAYTPGSTAKLVVSAAALEEGVISPSDRIMCRRIPCLVGDAYHCSHPPAAHPFDLAEALANSCNYFYAEVGARLSSPALAHWYAAFGFGAAGEDISPGEVRIPDKPRERVLAALGERGVTATPAQVLLAYSAIAMQGQVFRLIMPGQRMAPNLDRVVPLRKSTLAVLEEGLRGCVGKGSGKAAAVAGVSVAGKTGTAQALDGSHVTHAWFVGYAPADAPEVALVIYLKRGAGGADAAPLAARILKYYFAQKNQMP